MTTIIKASHIVKRYGEGENITHALNDVSLIIKNGEFVAIIGPSGSGKSTLMHILGCLDKPTRGTYFLNGEEISKLSDNHLAHVRNKTIGFVFQSFNLLPRTSAIKNVELPLIYAGVSSSIRLQKSKEMLTKVGLEERQNSTPAQLSGGQQQRVAIARALVNDAKIIMADEPTGNLDTKSSEEIMKLLESLNKEGKTIIIITHEMEVAKKARRIITIRDGKIVLDTQSRHSSSKSQERYLLKNK